MCSFTKVDEKRDTHQLENISYERQDNILYNTDTEARTKTKIVVPRGKILYIGDMKWHTIEFKYRKQDCTFLSRQAKRQFYFKY